MIKRSFIGLARPRFEYETGDHFPMEPETIPIPKQVTLLFPDVCGGNGNCGLSSGDRVKTGQKLVLSEESEAYVVSSVTGTISSISPFSGDFGQSYTAVSITVEAEEETDDAFSGQTDEFSLQNAADYLECLPGLPSFKALLDAEKPISTIVVTGVDADLLVATNQFAVKANVEDINRGISTLKRLTGADHVVIALPQHLMRAAGGIGGASGVELKLVDSAYPSALPHCITQDMLGKVIPAGQQPEDMGIVFYSAEAMASFGKAIGEKRIPVTKTVTLINKDLSKTIVQARIGTPISDIFDALGVTINDGDRLVVGGPMTGAAVYTEDYPVTPEMDAVMIQEGDAVSLYTDNPCINCGECIRICPAKMQVNMVVRFCEAGQYEEAADLYDLYSCIECGLCTVVCVSRMPIFQYIRLAKYELAKRIEEENTAEEDNV